MQFGILGPLEVRSAAGETLAVGGPRPRALLVLLLLDTGRVVGLDRLIDGQYGDDPPAGAANAVQAQVSRLRRGLPAGLVEFHGGGYRLTADPEDVDAHRFERLARDGRRLLAGGDHGGAAATLREALGLWRGPALADLPHGAAPAARLEDLRLGAAEDLAEAELALPEGASVAELRALAAAHPLRERLRGQLMRALHAAGRSAEALTEFEATRRLLADELGTGPSPELAAVHLAILRADRPAPPSRRRPAAQLTGFVGRDDELDRLAGLRDARLVTILGPGGTGKTRLAVEAAAREPREVCFADLAPLGGAGQPPETELDRAEQVPRAVPGGAGQVSQAVLGALGLRETGFQPGAPADPVRRLVAALAGQELLLILDNCEHVVAGAAELARTLLAGCPGLAILATSREPLGLTGEVLVPLAPLAVPPPGSTAADAATYPAVRLLAQRAAAVRPGFAVEPGNAGAMIEICAALDGLPLAIELAAARMRQFTAAEVAARLAEHGRFRLLSRGDRTAAARHRTLHAVVEWSWDLLTPAERTLARRFAVFTGGASPDAVAAVCGVADAEGALADLVDKSLVEAGGGRYRMLDTIRLYCLERLAEAGEHDELCRAHAAYHLELVQRADPHLRRAEQLDWLARLSAEHDNLMAALRWAVRHERVTGFRLIAALAAYLWLSGRRDQAGQAAAELLEGLPAKFPEGLDEEAARDGLGGLDEEAARDGLGGLAEEYVSCVVHAVPRAGAEHWERAREIVRTLDRALRHPFGAAVWGMAAGPPGPGADVSRLFGSDEWTVGLERLSEALLKVLGGRPAEGERQMLGVLDLFSGLGERWGIAQALDWLAQVASWRGEWPRAAELWTRALELMEQLGALQECGDLLFRRAAGLVRQGRLAEADADYVRAADLYARAGVPGTPAVVRFGQGEIARLGGDHDGAAVLLGRALEATEAGGFGAELTRTRVLTALGRLAELSGDAGEAVRRHGEAVATAHLSPLSSDLADAVEGLAGAALLTGSGERAALLLGVAVALRGMTVTGDPDVARTAEGARDLIGATAFAKEYARGAAMDHDQALSAVQSRER